MGTANKNSRKMIIGLKQLNDLNSKGYAGKFSLGDTVVLACGPWKDGPRWLHESEAVYDKGRGTYVERSCYTASRTINAAGNY